MIRANATVIQAKKGGTPISHQDSSNHVYLVLQGRVQAKLVSLVGHEVILGDLKEGDFFGDLAAIDEQPRSATVVTLSDCVLARLPAEPFRRAVTEVPDTALWLARRLTAQIRGLTDKVFELNALRVRSRLHCELFRMSNATTGATIIIDPAPTHADLAARIGTHREAITREINHLIGEGILEQHQRRLTILDMPALANLVQAATGFDIEMLQRSASGRPA